jgi:hypothetical protein
MLPALGSGPDRTMMSGFNAYTKLRQRYRAYRRRK